MPSSALLRLAGSAPTPPDPNDLQGMITAP